MPLMPKPSVPKHIQEPVDATPPLPRAKTTHEQGLKAAPHVVADPHCTYGGVLPIWVNPAAQVP
jgi:hypothetical protein